MLSACRHVNIVRYIQAFISEGCLHIVMEYATGGKLPFDSRLKDGYIFVHGVLKSCV